VRWGSKKLQKEKKGDLRQKEGSAGAGSDGGEGATCRTRLEPKGGRGETKAAEKGAEVGKPIIAHHMGKKLHRGAPHRTDQDTPPGKERKCSDGEQ